jgi:hypothetical protein
MRSPERRARVALRSPRKPELGGTRGAPGRSWPLRNGDLVSGWSAGDDPACRSAAPIHPTPTAIRTSARPAPRAGSAGLQNRLTSPTGTVPDTMTGQDCERRQRGLSPRCPSRSIVLDDLAIPRVSARASTPVGASRRRIPTGGRWATPVRGRCASRVAWPTGCARGSRFPVRPWGGVGDRCRGASSIFARTGGHDDLARKLTDRFVADRVGDPR